MPLQLLSFQEEIFIFDFPLFFLMASSRLLKKIQNGGYRNYKQNIFAQCMSTLHCYSVQVLVFTCT